MKAYLVREKDEIAATVVFAETAGKARVTAMATDACSEADFCSISVRRKPQLDKYYTEGKTEMDWYNAEDRIALVKEAGFWCDLSELGIEYCEKCPAKEFCDYYKDYIAEQEADNEN